MYKRLRSPLNVQVEMTAACHQACTHCYNFWRDRSADAPRLGQHLDAGRAVELMDRLADAGVFSVLLTGGEPLLNVEATLAAAERARARGLRVSLNSTLTPLDADLARRLKTAGINHVLTSILGHNAELHDRLAQARGSFARLLRNVPIAQAAGLRLAANMVVTRHNVDAVRETGLLVASLGIEAFTATKAGAPGNCSDFSDQALGGEEVRSVLSDLAWLAAATGVHVDTLEPVPHCALAGLERAHLFLTRKCHAGVTTMTISWDGTARPCSHLDVTYGNVLTDGMEAVWAGMVPWCTTAHLPDACTRCALLGACGGGCRMEAKTRTGRLDGLDPYATPQAAGEVHLPQRPPSPLREGWPAPLDRFSTAAFRLRAEAFGAALVIEPAGVVLLDEQGLGVMSQLAPGTDYAWPLNGVDWHGLDGHRFVRGLAERKVIHPQPAAG